jgi:ADP-dependent NAD(P)H-hydrate dehydratase / NAD(P)H-hydrate epimerase
MQSVLSRRQIQELDQHLVMRAKVPSLVLMENAGRGAALAILERWPEHTAATLVMCGTGNNGGDGFVVARHLAAAGCHVRLVALGQPEKLAPDASAMMGAWLGTGGYVDWVSDHASLSLLLRALGESRCVVDALFGTGLSKPVSGIHAEAVDAINHRRLPCCALDIPSGLDCNTGLPLGTVIHAKLTVTFAYPKPGLFSPTASQCVGELVTVSLGVPEDSWKRVGKTADRVDVHDVSAWLPRRAPNLHKGEAGRVAIVAGSPGTTGAALLAAQGALRAGAGLVTHIGFPSTINGIESRVLEAMTFRLNPETFERDAETLLSRFDVIVLGPGLGLSEDAQRLVRTILQTAAIPVVIDADALTLVSRTPHWMKDSLGPRILTPHTGEMARLLGTSAQTIDSDRFKAVDEAVALFKAVVLLKGPFTIVGAPNELPAVVGHPNPVLSTGGTGDVLAGVVGALLVSLEPRQAVICAAAWHSQAAKYWAKRQHADRGLLAHELADCLPPALAELTVNTALLSV